MELELKIISATDLTKTSSFTQNKPYVVVSISNTSHKTPIDASDGRNPNWNHLVTFSIPCKSSLSSDLTVKFQIRSGCSLAGEVCVPLKDLLNSATAAAKFVSYQVMRPSGKPKGVLTFSYRFKERSSDLAMNPEDVYPPLRNQSPEVVVYPPVYPPPTVVNTSYGYPVQGGNGYGYPVQTVSGYPRIYW